MSSRRNLSHMLSLYGLLRRAGNSVRWSARQAWELTTPTHPTSGQGNPVNGLVLAASVVAIVYVVAMVIAPMLHLLFGAWGAA